MGDGFVKRLKSSVFVIPAKAGIQLFRLVLDSRFRGSDVIIDFLRIHQILNFKNLKRSLYVGYNSVNFSIIFTTSSSSTSDQML
jgi:hypothetical protein